MQSVWISPGAEKLLAGSFKKRNQDPKQPSLLHTSNWCVQALSFSEFKSKLSEGGFEPETGTLVITQSDEESVEALRFGADQAFLIPGSEALFVTIASRLVEQVTNRAALMNKLTVNERVSEEMQLLNETLQVASTRFQELFNGLPVGCFTLDRDGFIQEWNTLATEIFGIQPWEAFGFPVWEVMDPDGTGSWSYQRVTDIFSSPEAYEFDWAFTRADGEDVFLTCKVICLCDTRGNRVAAIAGSIDITARVNAERKVEATMRELQLKNEELLMNEKKLQRALKQLETLATTDVLTGLNNRRQFQVHLAEAVGRVHREGKSLSLLLFDVDHFKQFNDGFGHQAGDQVLKKVGSILRKTARSNEKPARYGGEEFAIILESASSESAILAAERFRRAIEEGKWAHRNVTVSVGVSTFEPHLGEMEFIERADQALYESKRRGRNCSTHYREIASEAVV
jgi:diguanylate cyclase (GGDEF)-like protein/PAS domain S-box-containing protein